MGLYKVLMYFNPVVLLGDWKQKNLFFWDAKWGLVHWWELECFDIYSLDLMFESCGGCWVVFVSCVLIVIPYLPHGEESLP